MKTDLMTMGLLLLSGAFSGLLFDFYRMLRKEGRWNRLVTFCGDLLFSLLVLGILLFFFRKANFLEFRLYLFITSLAGLALYLIMASQKVKLFFARLISISKQIGKALSYRLRAVFKVVDSVSRFLLGIPYGILRWFGLLTYRFGEAIVRRFSQHTPKAPGVAPNGAGRKRKQKQRRQSKARKPKKPKG